MARSTKLNLEYVQKQLDLANEKLERMLENA